MDNRAERCKALFEWYEEHGLPEDEYTAINAVTVILTGGEAPEREPESMESRLESLEVAVTKLLRAQEPTEVSAPHRPSLRSNRYVDFLQSIHNLSLNLEQVGGEVEADKVAEVLDQMIVDFYEGEPDAQGDV